MGAIPRVIAISLFAAIFLLSSSLPAPAQQTSPFHVLTVAGGVIDSGGTGTFPVLFDSMSGNVAGWSIEVCHDPALLTLLTAESGATTQTIQYGNPPDFQEIVLLSEGYVHGVIIDVSSGAYLPPGNDYELVTGTYQALPFSVGSADLCVCNSLPTPANTVITLVGAVGVFPTIGCGLLTVPPPPPPPSAEFVRSDANDDGSTNIADVIWILLDLFVHGPHTDCDGANDANSDGNMDISDGLYILEQHFGIGPPPAHPYPTCGTVPLAADCEEFLSCP